MIKRILDEEELKTLGHHMDIKFSEKKGEFHPFLKHDPVKMANRFGNKHILQHQFFVWANKSEGVYDSMIAFLIDDVKFQEPIFVEYLWISKNPKNGYKLFKEATKFARDRGMKYIVMGSSDSHSKGRLEKFYKKMGFLKDSSSYITKL